MDAYCKITIFGFRHRVFQKKTTNRNVHAILDENVLMDLPSRRVLVRQAGRVAGRLGAVRGDVVTHIDGVSVANQTAQQITDSLQDKVGKGGSPVVVTLNAERSVAEALKRRARTIADQL